MNNTGEKQTAISKDSKEAFCLPKQGHIESNDSNQLHPRLNGQTNSRTHATEISILRAVFEDINPFPWQQGLLNATSTVAVQ